MQTLTTVALMRDWTRAAAGAGRRVGLVPTMGCLHEGHLNLVRRARALSDAVVVSIFVNPMQFGPGEDFARYPRDLERDAAMCAAEGVDVVFAPAADEMYAADASTAVQESVLSRGLCGASRPTHFAGVTTVVAKLFNIVQPHVAVFGQKDAQQARVIRRMVRDLDFPVAIDVAPVVREADGLAMSSRNAYLNAEERRWAPHIHAALREAADLYGGGERRADRLRALVLEKLAGGPDTSVDYVACVDEEDLHELERVDRPAILAVAVKVGRTRLIDNVVLAADGRE